MKKVLRILATNWEKWKKKFWVIGDESIEITVLIVQKEIQELDEMHHSESPGMHQEQEIDI